MLPKPPSTSPGHNLPKPAPGWKYASAILDSGSTIDCFNDASIFSDCYRADKQLKVADNSTIQLKLQGLARLHTYDIHGRPVSISFPDATSDSRLQNLVSLGKAQRRHLKIVTDGDQPHIVLQSGRKVPLRRNGDLLHIDFLVPIDRHSTTKPFDDTCNFASPQRTTYAVDICAGTSSAFDN